MSPNVKLVLYLFPITVLAISTGTADYTAADVATWQPWDWFQLVIKILGSIALSIRMFYDQSVARAEAAKLTNGRTTTNGETQNESTKPIVPS